MPDDGRDIPEPLKREVRQRCGFGCVICGLPLYEYEHMEGWAIVTRHVASEITLLCDKHHREKTSGLLPLSAVRAADKDPKNLQAGESASLELHYSGSNCTIKMGSNTFGPNELWEGSEVVALRVEDKNLISFAFEDGKLLLSLMTFDSDGTQILWVDRNELKYCISPWDIRLEGRLLSIREAKGRFLYEVRFNPPDSIEIVRATLAYDGHEVLITPDAIYYLNLAVKLENATFTKLKYFLVIAAAAPPHTGMHFTVRNRHYAETSRENVLGTYRSIGCPEVHLVNERFAIRMPSGNASHARRVGMTAPERGPDPAATKYVVSIGESDAELRWQGDIDQPLFIIFDQSLTFAVIDGKLLVSLQFLGADRQVAAALQNNQLTINTNNEWDRNYSDDAVEVINLTEGPVLQIKKDGAGFRIQYRISGADGELTAIWCERTANGIEGKMDLAYSTKQAKAIPKLMPLFHYPSESHLGIGNPDSDGAMKTVGQCDDGGDDAEDPDDPYAVRLLQIERHDEIMKAFPLGYVIIGRDGTAWNIPDHPSFKVSANWAASDLLFNPVDPKVKIVIPEFKWEDDGLVLNQCTILQEVKLVLGPATRMFDTIGRPAMYFTVASDNPYYPVIVVSFRVLRPE